MGGRECVLQVKTFSSYAVNFTAGSSYKAWLHSTDEMIVSSSCLTD